jgi:phosphoribosyl 1,2-cyclic phosphodiesterase
MAETQRAGRIHDGCGSAEIRRRNTGRSMLVKFWGVRGSIPTPLTAPQLKSRIAAVVQRIRPSDLDSAESREIFLANLPPHLFGTVGGNTTCVEISDTDGTLIIIDAGSGIRELGIDLKNRVRPVRDIHVLFTHFHWDHLQGLPFFEPAFDGSFTITFHSPAAGYERFVRNQMRAPYFPIEMGVMNAKISFEELKDPVFRIGDIKIKWKRMKHPGSSYSYRFSRDNKAVIFATDSEITSDEFDQTDENRSYFADIDILILDSQYTLEESINKRDWGHTSYSLAVDLATQWSIKNLVLFHHEPQYNDKKVMGILRSAQWYKNHLANNGTNVVLAIEGMEMTV